MARVEHDSAAHEGIRQVRAIHNAVRRSIAHIVGRTRDAATPAEALSDHFLQSDLARLADATKDTSVGGRVSHRSLGEVSGLLSELNGVLASAAAGGDDISDSQRTALQRRVDAIVGAIGRLSGVSVPADASGAMVAAAEIRGQLLDGDPASNPAGTADLAGVGVDALA